MDVGINENDGKLLQKRNEDIGEDTMSGTGQAGMSQEEELMMRKDFYTGKTSLILGFLVVISGIAMGLFVDSQLFKTLKVERGHFLLGIAGGILAAKLVDLLSGEPEFSMNFSQLTITFMFGTMIGVGLGFNLYYSLPAFFIFAYFLSSQKRKRNPTSIPGGNK
jgi:hypothetical protein